jgi:transposase-like protein
MAIIEQYKHRESSVEEALIKMYFTGISILRAEDRTEALRGSRVIPDTVSSFKQEDLPSN